jgi:integrase
MLSAVITRYLALKTALGRRYALERRVFEMLTAFLQSLGDGPADLTPETFTTWAQTLQHLTPTVRRNRLRIVRNLCLYRRRTEPGCFAPDIALFPAPHQPRAPYIFTPKEIARLIGATGTLPSTSQCPLRPDVFRLAIILLYTTGLRRGELLRLTLADYARDEHVLLIRETKFHKSRAVPLSPATAREVDRYLQARRHRQLSLAVTTPLVAHGVTTLRGYTGVGLGTGFRHLLTTASIRTPEGRWPRVHDLRHTFAVHALARWYQTGPTSKPSCLSSRRTWGTCQSSPPRTTCHSSSRSGRWPPRASSSTAVRSCRLAPALGSGRDDRAPECLGLDPPGILR